MTPALHRSWLAAFAAALASTVASPARAASTADAPAASHAAQHAHVHGIAKLGVAVQDKTVTLVLEAPLDSLIGFEHRPTTPAQQRAVAALRARLKAPAGLFSFDAAAACELVGSEAESTVFQPASSGAAGEPADANDAHEAHGDLDASFDYRCAHPERLTALDVGLFQAYPKLKKIEVDIATAGGQFRRELSSPQRRVALVR